MTTLDQLYNITNTQAIADMLLAQIEQQATRDSRDAAVGKCQEFERAGWVPAAFEDAAATAPGEFYFDDEGRLTYHAADNGAAEICAVLTDYLRRIGPPPQVSISDLFTTSQAADYLGMSVAGIKKNVYRSKRLKPIRNSAGSLLFTREELDRFRDQVNHKAGRPTKNK